METTKNIEPNKLAKLPSYFDKEKINLLLNEKLINKSLIWLKARKSSEKNLILLAIAVIAFMMVYTIIESTLSIYNQQRTRHNELQENLKRIPPLLARYNQLKEKQKSIDSRFSGTNSKQQNAANYAHLEWLIKRKAQVASQFDIRKGSETTVQGQYLVVPFSVRFQQMSNEELSNFLKELSDDPERPSIISRFSVRTRGNSLLVELNIDFISRVA